MGPCRDRHGRPLTGGHPGPGIPVEDDGVEAADVDAEFEGVRAPEPADSAVVEAGLDLPTAVVRGGGPVGLDAGRQLGVAAIAERAGARLGLPFGGLTGAGEHDRLVATPLDAAVTERGLQTVVEVHVPVGGLGARDDLVGTDLVFVVRAVPEPGDGVVHAPASGRGGLTVASACGRVLGGVTPGPTASAARCTQRSTARQPGHPAVRR